MDKRDRVARDVKNLQRDPQNMAGSRTKNMTSKQEHDSNSIKTGGRDGYRDEAGEGRGENWTLDTI